MARIETIKQIPTPKSNEIDKATDIDSTKYKTLIQELIRLDVPILEVGSSSIGKSYSIRQFAEECGMNAEFLFVGTEKSEFIEGIPNLKGITGDTAKFSYLKPYWFPDKDIIKCKLQNGKAQLESLLDTDDVAKSYYDAAFEGTGDYTAVNDLKIRLQTYKKIGKKEQEKVENFCAGDASASKYIYADALLYLSTLQGFGNFWLILDEIDKVEEQDKDKYAPLLHIVRERELKGWKLSGIRSSPEYDIKHTISIVTRKKRFDAALLDPKVDVTDTRIIAIANDLDNMEKGSPALYRRFVKIIIRKSLYDAVKVKEVELGDNSVAVGFDWTKQYEIERQNIHSCIVDKDVDDGGEDIIKKKKGGEDAQNQINLGGDKGKTIGSRMAEIEREKCGNSLEEMNLQWTLGFFPDILFPGKSTDDKQGKGVVKNLIIEDFNKETNVRDTLVFKIIEDNFAPMYWKPTLYCIHDQIKSEADVTQSDPNVQSLEDADKWYLEAGIKDYENPSPASVDVLVSRYAKKLDGIENKFKGAIDVQKGITVEGQEVGVDQSLQKQAFDAIKLGFTIINKSINAGKPTTLTRMLFSSIPFIQTKIIANSPYIAYGSLIQLVNVQDNGIVAILEKLSGDEFDSEIKAKDASVKVFAMLEPYRPLIVKYAVGVPSDMVETIADGGYDKITDINSFVNSIIENRPVIVDNTIVSKIKDDKLKMKYFNSISNVKVIEKEMLENLPGVVLPLVVNEFEKNGLNDELYENLVYYIQKFPNTMITLASLRNTPAELGDFIKEKANEVLDNLSEYSVSERDLVLKK
jgi:hypothetical protein